MGPKQKRQPYTEATLNAAIAAVKVDKVSQWEAAKWFGIPRRTLQDAVRGVYQNHRMGPEGALTREEEKFFIENCLNFMHKIGCPREEEEILDDIAQMCAEKPVGHKYKDYKPGHSWFTKFQEQNKDLLSWHALSKVSLGHAGVTKKMIEGWFSEALRYIAYIPGGMEALSDLTHVFNMDESGFAMDAGTGHIKTVMGSMRGTAGAQAGTRHEGAGDSECSL